MQITPQEFARVANNFYNLNNVPTDVNRINLDISLYNYLIGNLGKNKKFKVAFCWICLNQPYWQYAQTMIEGARQFFLPGHDVDYFVWSDMPPDKLDVRKKEDKNAFADGYNAAIEEAEKRKFGATIFPTEAVEWPLPTLMRYHLFLQQEEVLKDYDYIFYSDVDMKFVNIVGDEILGKDWTAALHPGYAVRKEYWPPIEPNEQSAAYIKRPGKVIDDKGKPRFMPLYYAGGFQGATSNAFLEGCKEMKKMVDKDMARSYLPIWNDESIFNRYLFDNPPSVILTPSYIYPDSLIKEYYEPLWGCSYVPKIITLTKSFSVSKEGGDAVQKMIKQ